jgi:uncharacterized protein (DUF1330 family)
MSAYLIAMIEVTDWEKYREYTKASSKAVARYGGRFIVRGGDKITLEGPEENRRIVVIEFPSLEQVKTYYDSKEYQEAKRLRLGAAIASFVAVQGA